MDWLADHAAAVWAMLAVLLGVAEMVSLDLFLIMLAGGAGAGAVAALLGAPFALQAIVAAVTSIALLGMVRPPVVKKLHGQLQAWRKEVGAPMPTPNKPKKDER